MGMGSHLMGFGITFDGFWDFMQLAWIHFQWQNVCKSNATLLGQHCWLECKEA